MKNYTIIISLFIAVLMFSSCSKSSKENTTTSGNKNAPTTTTTTTPPDDKKVKENSEKPMNEGVKTIKAKFVDFSFGDAEHYYFKDESGKDWEFGGDDSDKDFAVELSEAETNEKNQGWGPNTKHQGKWFNIKYEIRKQPQYQDGPMADVPVILEAALAN